jgi:hypothetical protein
MTAWVHRLVEDPSEELLLAARAAHLRRWEIPRSSFPEGRKAYLQWRRKLYDYQAEKAGEILRGIGYPEGVIVKVRDLISKRVPSPLPNPPPKGEGTSFEDALCLVFLENEFEEFRKKHDEGKLIRIVQKTWAKMSESGRKAALGIHFGDEVRHLLAKALAGPETPSLPSP